MNFRNIFRKSTKKTAAAPARPAHNDAFIQIREEYESMLQYPDKQKFEVYDLFRQAYRNDAMLLIKKTEYPSMGKRLPTPVEYTFYSIELNRRIYIRETYPCQNVGMYMVRIQGYKEQYFDKYNLAAMRAARLIEATERKFGNER